MAENGIINAAAASSIEDQIRQRWGQYGNWQHADQDLVAQLAGLFRENGISDISNLQFKPRTANHRIVEQGESGPINEYDVQRQVYDAFLGDQQIGYLGDVNRDGSYTRGGQEARNHGGMEDIGRMGMDGNLLAWSAGVQGKDGAKGHLNFQIVQGPDGNGVVVPVWESSAAGDIENAKMVAATIAAGVGGYYLGPEAAAGTAEAGGGAGWDAAMIDLANSGGITAADMAGETAAVGGGAAGSGADWASTAMNSGTMDAGGLINNAAASTGETMVGSSALTSGGAPSIATSVSDAMAGSYLDWAQWGLDAASAVDGATPQVTQNAPQNTPRTAQAPKAPATPAAEPTMWDKAGEFITRNKLAPALLNMGGGMISRYMAARNQEKMDEDARKRYAEGYSSGSGLSLFKKVNRGT